MLPLPAFHLHSPRSVGEAIALLDELGPDTVIIAGGTDLLPNMKRGLLAPRDVVSLKEITSLSSIRDEGEWLHIGAMTTLSDVAQHAVVRERAFALAEAAGAVGGPQHRNMGTIGGNLCLDTRCRYYDQTYFWRSALGFCLKKDGTVCHVVAGGQKCVAAASNDTATAAIALGATLEIASAKGLRSIPASEFYTADGIKNTVHGPGDVVVALRVPMRAGRTSAYEKLRRRGAIDFPMLSVAARADIDGGRVQALEIVVSALAARPRGIKGAMDLAKGKLVTEIDLAKVAAQARKECNPLPNIEGDTPWRKEMVPVLVERALRRLQLGS